MSGDALLIRSCGRTDFQGGEQSAFLGTGFGIQGSGLDCARGKF
jgi:hypothetical protein